nr:poly [ADP-ribose] polymerase 1 [Tanacetum cinerariifolium]
MVAILEKTEHNTDFHRIVDFLEASHIWIETTDQETKIIATVDGKPWTISESSLRRHLKLNDKEGISYLLDAELFKNLSVMGYNILPSQRRLTKRAIRIAQSKALSPDADEPASLSRDDRHGEAFPTVSSLDAGQDRENITKTSAMSHESSPRVPSFDADEGKRRCKEPIQEDAPITGGIIDIGEELGAAKSTEKGSNDTEEMVNVLSSMEATNILSSKGTAFSTASVSPAGVFPTTGVPTVSESFPTVSAIFTTASVVTPYIRRSRAEADLSVGEKIELISELVKYQDHLADILKYQTQQSKPSSKKEQRRFYMSVLKSHIGWKTEYFRGMIFEHIKEKFIPLVPLEEVYIEALQVKHPIIDWEIHTKGKREYWKIIRLGDSEDLLWTYHQAFMHDPLDWKLYDTCGVHHVSTKKNQEIFMLVEKDYPLRKGLATLTSKGFIIGSAKLKGVVDRDQKLKMAKTRDGNQNNELDHSKLKSLLKAQTKEAEVIKDDLKNHVSTSELRVMPEANN